MNELPLSNTADRHLGRILQMQAEQNGATEFLITDDQRITFAEAEDISNRLASGFQSLGVKPEDRVSFLMENTPEMILMCLALNKIGAIWVPVCTDYKGEWLLDTLLRSKSTILVTDKEYISRVQAIQSRLEYQHVVILEDDVANKNQAVSYETLLNHNPYDVDYNNMSYGDTCAILWTSGTTGKSKGVMQAHNNWVRSTLLGASLMYNCEKGDIIYCALPLYNSGAWITCVIRALIAGIGCVIEKKFSVTQFIDRITHFGATQTFVVGSMGVFLMGSEEKDNDADNPLREACIVPMPPNLWQAFEKRFDVHLARTGLGQSECLLTLNQEHSDVELPTYALGFPTPDVDVRLFDDDGNEVKKGEAGEICVKPLAPHILFNGYFDDKVATDNAYRGEWFLTGDMARQDPENGGFYFVDRKKDAVRFAGRNISTMEVESVVLRHPDVKEVAAFGIPSKALESEDELKLNVVLTDNAKTIKSEEGAISLCEFIAENAPHYFVPIYFEFVDSLPYTPTNKIQKFKLRERGVSESAYNIKQMGFKVKSE